MPTKLTPEIINAAILGFEGQKRHIDSQIAELRMMLSGGPAESAATPEAPARKRKISAAARRGQQARWAKIRREPEPTMPATAEPAKPKRRISEEGMKRIIAATKKRWRLAKAAKAQPATAKKTLAKRVAVKKVAKTKSSPAKRTKAAKKAAPTPAQVVANAAAE